MIFYLGTHKPAWLWSAGVPLFVSRRRLCEAKTLRPAKDAWALDSGGFTELQKFGRWTVTPADYAREVRRWQYEIGGLAWAAAQDWMAEPAVRMGGTVNGARFAGTGLSVAEHQRRTVDNYLELRALAPGLPWVPVLQGWEYGDYLRHLDDYDKAGVDLRAAPLVGLGSVCRRQDTGTAEALCRELCGLGIRLHAFGFKLGGLRRAAPFLGSADSMAWSFAARRGRPLPGCPHAKCANCLRYALKWRGRVVGACARAEAGPRQGVLWG